MRNIRNIWSWAGTDYPNDAMFTHELPKKRDEFVRAFLSQYLPSDIQIESIKALLDYQNNPFFSDTQQGKYLLTLKQPYHGQTKVFINVKAGLSKETMELGSSIFKKFRENGILTPQILPNALGSNVSTFQGYDVVFQSFLEGKHPCSNYRTLFELGKTIGSMGNILKILNPNQLDVIKKGSLEQYEMWKNGINFIKSGKIFEQLKISSEQRKVLEECAQLFKEGELLIDAPGTAPSHFDMVEANMLFDGTNIVVLDYETFQQGFAPPLYDLGMAATRVGLGAPKNKTSKELPAPTWKSVSPLLEGYNKTADIKATPEQLVNSAKKVMALKLLAVSDRISKLGNMPVLEKELERGLSFYSLATDLQKDQTLQQNFHSR